jgi:hypothetical protein
MYGTYKVFGFSSVGRMQFQPVAETEAFLFKLYSQLAEKYGTF